MDRVFDLGNMLALTGWVSLLAALFVRPVRKAALTWAGLLIPVLLAVAYIVLLASARDAHGGFGSIAQVRSLFQSDAALTAGWFHYLAFDLFVGSFIVRDGLERIANPLGRLVLIPCLALTFLFGPSGLLMYLALRLSLRRTPVTPQAA